MSRYVTATGVTQCIGSFPATTTPPREVILASALRSAQALG